MIQFYFNQLLIFGPKIFFLIIFLLVGLVHFFKNLTFFKNVNYKILIYLVLGLSFLYSIMLTVIQYFIWAKNSFSLFFLPPYQPWSYFISYSFFHFFFSQLITLFIALLIYFIFKFFKKYKPEFITSEAISLLFLSSLMSPWPIVIIFLALFLILSLFLALFNLFFYKKEGINWFFPIFSSLILSFFIGSYLVSVFGLGVLVV